MAANQQGKVQNLLRKDLGEGNAGFLGIDEEQHRVKREKRKKLAVPRELRANDLGRFGAPVILRHEGPRPLPVQGKDRIRNYGMIPPQPGELPIGKKELDGVATAFQRNPEVIDRNDV